jgi:hypothetical protein
MSEPEQGPAVAARTAPTLLEQTAAVAFGLSSVLTSLMAITAWPDVAPGGLVAVLRLWLFQTGILFSTTLALSLAWLLPLRSPFPWLGLMAIPLLFRILRDLFFGPAPWPVGLGVLSAGYLLGALVAVVMTVIRSATSAAG